MIQTVWKDAHASVFIRAQSVPTVEYETPSLLLWPCQRPLRSWKSCWIQGASQAIIRPQR